MSVAELAALLDEWYPPAWAADWDRVGLVVGEPELPVSRVHFTVDCTPETVAEAITHGAGLIVAHHPLLLRGVSSVASTTYKGRIIRDLIRAEVALYVAHTNADIANPGVNDALAARLGLTQLRPLVAATGAGAGGGRGSGRVGVPENGPLTLAEFAAHAKAVLPATSWGVRTAGDPDRMVNLVAVSGGAGDAFLKDAAASGADVFLTSDLRHHPASEHMLDGGPALIDAAHWATERPWLDDVARRMRAEAGVDTVISDTVTDPWNI
ncbi:Nif3-like dinuclear metal center hexameric protein [Longispora albida]|uniref:Nif3-like dinuclear metal center hexameric protein n=1 Tax=Longispora albida TaxID=203523 RepID=UPI00037EB176|nr:Nif3-like dinuclear metal center hexameric protein [Longispora albida]